MATALSCSLHRRKRSFESIVEPKTNKTFAPSSRSPRAHPLTRTLEKCCGYSFHFLSSPFISFPFENHQSRAVRNDKAVALEAVRRSGWNLAFLSPERCGDRDVVLEAVRRRGLALEWASDRLTRDPSVVLVAVKENGLALRWSWKEAKNSREVNLAAVSQNGNALRSCLKVRFNGRMDEYELIDTNRRAR